MKLPKRYMEKANDSFRTKRNLYLFSKALENSWHTVGLEDFRQFEISDDLVRTYTTIYWQYEADFPIRPGMTNESVFKQIELKEKELKEQIEQFRIDYISNSFPDMFPMDRFQGLLNYENCIYCGLTISMIHELANKQKLYKKNYRGWSLEIDRKDSNREYTPDNCVMACYWCNNAKTDEFTHEEFRKVGEVIKKIWADRLSAK